MIEIKLMGEDAAQYIRNERVTDMNVQALIEENNKLKQLYTTQTEVLKQAEAYIAQLEKANVSQRVKDDTEKAKAMSSSPFVKPLPKPNLPKSGTKWTVAELKAIEYALGRPEGEGNRKLSHLCNVLTRSEGAIRAKLNEIGVSIKNGFIVGNTTEKLYRNV
jgi:hypothetical protein